MGELSPFHQGVSEVAMFEATISGPGARWAEGAGTRKFEAYLAHLFTDADQFVVAAERLTATMLASPVLPPAVAHALRDHEPFRDWCTSLILQWAVAQAQAEVVHRRRTAPLTIPDTPKDPA